MATLIIDNSIHRFVLKEGMWTARFIKDEIDIRLGEMGLKKLNLSKYNRVILTGSEASILKVRPWMERQMEVVREIMDRGLPLLGICFGHQLIARALGGPKCVRRSPKGEFGWFPIELSKESKLFYGLSTKAYQLCTHFDEVIKPPHGFKVIARSPACPVQAMAMSGKPVWGIQFHPEVRIKEGKRLLYLIKILNPRAHIGVKAASKTAQDSEIAPRLFANFMGIA